MTPEQEQGIMQAFDAYCKTVLRNKARNLHKERKRREYYEISIDDLPPETEQELSQSEELQVHHPVALSLPGAKMYFTDPDLATAAFRVLPRFRDIIYLAYYLDYNDKEIAELLNAPPSTVTSRRNNTINKLHDILGDKHGT